LAVEEAKPPVVVGVPGNELCAPACVPPVNGVLAIFSTQTGRPVLQRALSFLNYSSGPPDTSSSLMWSPDGSWVFLTANDRSIDAVPAFSATAPVKTIDLTNGLGSASTGAENFIVTSAEPAGAHS
jgi:hypothetical protein